MSGMGENTSDPSRAESRKRKDPDQVGPRLDHLILEILRENELKKCYMCICFSVRSWQTAFLQREVSAKLLYCSNSVLLRIWDGDEDYSLLLLFVCLFWIQHCAKMQKFGDNLGEM